MDAQNETKPAMDQARRGVPRTASAVENGGAEFLQLIAAFDQLVDAHQYGLRGDALLRLRQRLLTPLFDLLHRGVYELDSVADSRQVFFHLFLKLATLNSRSEQIDERHRSARIYCSASNCTDAGYFERPFIRYLLSQFTAASDEGVHDVSDKTRRARLAEVQPGHQDSIVPIRRMVVVPDRFWTVTASLDHESAEYWKRLARALDTQEQIGIEIQCMSDRLLDEAFGVNGTFQLERDFGLYGEHAVGVYRFSTVAVPTQTPNVDDARPEAVTRDESFSLYFPESDEYARYHDLWRTIWGGGDTESINKKGSAGGPLTWEQTKQFVKALSEEVIPS